MIYILGKKIPDNFLLSQGLLKIYGIGGNTSEKICKYFGFLKKIRVKDLSNDDWSDITNYIGEKNFRIQKNLFNKVKSNISILINIRNYRGLRHYKGLSVRGQRTHSNARTQKKLYINRAFKRYFSTNSNFLINFNYSNSNHSSELNNKVSFFKKKKPRWIIFFKKCFKKYKKNIKNLNNKIENLNKNKKLSVFKIKKLNIPTNKFKKFKKKVVFLFFPPKEPNTKINIGKEFRMRSNIKEISRNNLFLNRNFKLDQYPEVTLYINVRYSNLFVFAYDTSGNLLAWASGGSLNLKGRQQGSRYAGKIVTDAILLKLKELKIKIKYLSIIIKGKGPSRRASLTNIRKKRRFTFVHVINSTQVAYNGCRVKKKRR
jgi:small subunit ribosomal protein S13